MQIEGPSFFLASWRLGGSRRPPLSRARVFALARGQVLAERFEGRLTLIHGRFSQMDALLDAQGVGKAVSVVRGLPPRDLDAVAKDLKKHCGSGGTVKDGAVEIQGDHREKIAARLEAQGYQVKLAGG